MHRSIFQTICVMVLSLLTVGSAQIQWEKFYGGGEYEFADRLIELSDHNLLICSYTLSYGAGDADIWMVKVTPAGDTIWTRTYGGEKYECATAVHELSDGSLLVAGNTGSFVADTVNCAWDVWLLKLDAAGDTVWTKTFYGNRSAGVDMVVDAQENIYLAANSVQDDPLQNLQVIKCRSDGTKEWVHYYGGTDRETLESFIRTSDGAFLLLATSQSFSPKTMWLFKIDENGDILWDKTFGGNFRYGNASDIIELPNGTYMLAGYNGATTQTTLFILNMSADGTVNWQKNYSEFTSDWAPCFTLLSSGNFFISATELPKVGRGRQVRLIRMNDTGTVLWTDVIGDTGVYTVANSFLETTDGKFLMLGGTNRETKAADDLWLVSITPDRYITMGGVLEYHLVEAADSADYAYTLLSAPPRMTVSSGGTITWQPQTDMVSSELVAVAMTSGAVTDTIGFIVHVNRKGTGVARHAAAEPFTFKVSAQPRISVCVSGNGTLISAPADRFVADVYSLSGTKIISLSGIGAKPVLWNHTDAGGYRVKPGKYIVRITSGGFHYGNAAVVLLR